MSDAHRRLFCRTAFAAICLLPTLVVINWAVFPRSIGEWESEARLALGCAVEIGRAETPRPNELVLRDVRLRHTTLDHWTTLESVSWRRAVDRQSVEIGPLQVDASQLTGLIEHLCTQIPRLNVDVPCLELSVPRITVRSDMDGTSLNQIFALRDCRVRIDCRAAQPRVAIEFFTEQTLESPVRWEVIYGSAGQPTRWSLNTNNHVIPNWLIGHAFPAVRALGEKSWFAGLLSGAQDSQEAVWEVDNVQLLNIDPARIAADEHALNESKRNPSIQLASGARCAALVKHARLVNHRIESLYAEIHWEGGGRVTGRLLNAARKWLRVDLAEHAPGQSVEIGKLALALEIRDGSLSIHGQSPDGLIAVDRAEQPMIYATAASQGLAPYSLAGWIADDGSVQLPLSATALEFMSYLPVIR